MTNVWRASNPARRIAGYIKTMQGRNQPRRANKKRSEQYYLGSTAMNVLTTAELQTLAIIGNPESCDSTPRNHLEKLYRLDLIEPGHCGPALSTKGREILFSRK